MSYDHEDPKHIYGRRNPSGCDKFYCLRRFSLRHRIRIGARSLWDYEMKPNDKRYPRFVINAGPGWGRLGIWPPIGFSGRKWAFDFGRVRFVWRASR